MDNLVAYEKKVARSGNHRGAIAVYRHIEPKIEFLHSHHQTISSNELRQDFYDLVRNDPRFQRNPYSNDAMSIDEMSVIFIGA